MAPNQPTDLAAPRLHTAEPIRLFLALSLPEEVKHSLEQVQSELRQLVPTQAARWTRREQFHLTLRFLGDVAPEQVDQIVESARAACRPFDMFQLTAASLGFFPEPRLARVLWAGIRDAKNNLAPLWAVLQSAMAPFTTQPAESSFVGHITLARLNRMSRALAGTLVRAAAKYENRVFGSWTAGELELMRSELLAQGARYTVLARMPFDYRRDHSCAP
jgi:RNA 2',3'-cyclic 3'-phosphodiesterase